MTVSEYAAHRRRLGLLGGTARSVRAALASGRIEREPDGSIDPRRADAAWLANTDPGRAFGAEIARSLRDAEGGSDE